MDIVSILCREFGIQPTHCQSVVSLIDDGNTIPFIARYRKEMTGSMDDQVLREVFERLQYLRSLDKRREEIKASLVEQKVLTEELSRQTRRRGQRSPSWRICTALTAPSGRTRATIAREKGLEPLSLLLLMQNEKAKPLAELAAPFLSEEKGVATVEDALAGGARHHRRADERRRGCAQGRPHAGLVNAGRFPPARRRRKTASTACITSLSRNFARYRATASSPSTAASAKVF